MTQTAKTKIAILGGGVGGITAAFALTSPDNPRRDEFEITVYQMGWRIGGKGASGRSREQHQRIQEHGLHIWLGFYENAFRAMRECYAELGRPSDAPLATWEQAFVRHGATTLEEWHDGKWKRWDEYYPQTDESPGDGRALPSPAASAQVLLGWLIEDFGGVPGNPLRELLGVIAGVLETLAALVFTREGLKDLHRAWELMKIFIDKSQLPEHRAELARLLKSFRAQAVADMPAARNNDARRRLLLNADLSLTVLVGLVDDGVIGGSTPFAALDVEEFRTWLRRHGAQESTILSAPVRGYYDLAFAYRDGISDAAHQDVGAGTCVRTMMLMQTNYKGALMWKMQAGMGDTVFGPYYEVLRRRGVRFAFFHKIEELQLDAEGQFVERIRIARQVDVKSGEYAPLVDVKGLPCWPSEPLYDQLVQGEALQRGPAPHTRPYNLESDWSGWTNVEERWLQCGSDFDQVVLAISIAALPRICPDLIKRLPGWADMVGKIQTVQTLGVQLWLKPTTEALGSPPVYLPDMAAPQRTVMAGYAQPLNTWADMSQLLLREVWPAAQEPGSLAYLCGVVPAEPLPPASDTDFPARESARARGIAVDWLSKNIGTLWPKGTLAPQQPQSLDWNLLAGAQGSGEQRFDSQYWRINIDRTERYVLSAAGTIGYRLRPDQSGARNLVLAGDWTRNHLSAGDVESATISGLLAARALSGYPTDIAGEHDWG